MKRLLAMLVACFSIAACHDRCVASHTELQVVAVPTGNNNMPLQNTLMPVTVCDKWEKTK